MAEGCRVPPGITKSRVWGNDRPHPSEDHLPLRHTLLNYLQNPQLSTSRALILFQLIQYVFKQRGRRKCR